MKLFWQNVEHYLLLSISLSFFCGIVLHFFFPLSLNIATGISGFFLLLALFSIQNQSPTRGVLFLLLLVLSLGFYRSAYHKDHFIQGSTICSKIETESDVVVSGTLHSMPLFDGEKTTLLLNSHYIRKKQTPDFKGVSGLVMIKLRDKLSPKYKPGDEIIIRCKLSRPYKFGNPGGFDYPAFLAAKNIGLVGHTRSTANIHALQYEKTLFRQVRYFPERLRCTIRDFLNDHLVPQHAAIYRALLIGDRSGIAKDQYERFKASGVVHIFAISGIHLSLVASALFLVFFWLLKRSQYLLLRFSCKKIALLCTIPFLISYTLLAGAQTPVVRSLIMVIVFILAFCIQRQRSPFTTLSFAALFILVINPVSLFTVSFQLSFVAVLSLIFILPKLKTLFRKTDEECSLEPPLHKKATSWILAALLISLAATFGTAPLLLHYFNRISTVGPLANLILEPLLCLWSLSIGLLAIPLIYIAPPIAGFLFSFGESGISSALYICDFLSKLPFATVWFATPSPVIILCYYLAILFCLSQFTVKSICLFLLSCSLLFFPPRSLFHYFNPDSELIFLDVGQGSANLVTLPHGKTILIDGGGAFSRKFNVGESVIAPYLWHKGFTHIDAILISHPDSDHYNGIPFLLKRFKPEIVWINGDEGHDRHYEDLLNLARALHIEIRVSRNEQILIESAGARLQNINNPFQNDTNASSNDRSLALRFSHGETSCILSGDISRRVEKSLLLKGENLQANILLSPHHGSNTSNSSPFLKEVNPQQIIVSAGRFHPHHFPSVQLRSYCKSNSIALLNTANHGAIMVKITNDSKTITSFRK